MNPYAGASSGEVHDADTSPADWAAGREAQQLQQRPAYGQRSAED